MLRHSASLLRQPLAWLCQIVAALLGIVEKLSWVFQPLSLELLGL
jgi:hypothetical protein